MPQTKTHFHSIRKIVLFGILTAVLFLVICPAVELTRGEYQIGRAYNKTCEIAASLPDSPMTSIDETDPWGEPYKIIESLEGPTVLSSGPNRTSPLSGLDSDDIHSGMLVSPMDAIIRNKQRRLIIAMSLPVLWLLGSIMYVLIGKFSSASDSTSEERPYSRR